MSTTKRRQLLRVISFVLLVHIPWDANKTYRNIKVKEGLLNRVEDYKYLGGWILNSNKDFLIRKELVLKAARSLVRVWKSHTITREVKVQLFLATDTVESAPLYNVTTCQGYEDT